MKSFIKIIIFIVASLLILKGLKSYLVIDEEPKRVDAIVVYSGDAGDRTEKGIELLKEKYADILILSGGAVYEDLRMADLMKDHSIRLGIPEEQIVVEREANSTYENALFVKEILMEKGYESVIVVTSDYHTRRTKLTTDKVLKDSGIESIVISTESEFSKEGLLNPENILVMINEYIKLLGYIAKGRII